MRGLWVCLVLRVPVEHVANGIKIVAIAADQRVLRKLIW